MHSALFVVEAPQGLATNPKLLQQWQFLVARAAELQQQLQGIQRLSEGTWQCSLANGLSPLAELVQAAGTAGFAYRVLFFETEPKWVVQKPKTA